MWSDIKATRVVVFLVVLGSVSVGLRFRARRLRQLEHANTFWRLTYFVEFESEEPGSSLSVALPADGARCSVLRRDFRSPRLALAPPVVDNAGNRWITVSSSDRREHHLILRFDLRWKTSSEPNSPETALDEQTRKRYLQAERGIQTDSPVVAETLQRLQPQAAGTALADLLYEYCRKEIATDPSEGAKDAETTLRQQAGTPLGRARVMVALCRAASQPARLVTGFILEEAPTARPGVWVEVWSGGRWVPYDLQNGFARRLPWNYMPVCRGGASLLQAAGECEAYARFSIATLPIPSNELADEPPSLFEVLDLTRLPLEMHPVISIILLIPLGALVTCVFRNVIGIETSGTFAPTLLALSFVFSDWRTGLFLFALVVLLGSVTRRMVENLKLLLLPRFSVILTLVVWCLVFGVSLLDYLELTPSANAVLLPMVILTMIVERFYVTAQEDGLHVALKRLAGTILVGGVCYSVLRWETLAGWLLAYPEAHFVTLAALVALGRYTGYRLTELWRFRDMAR